MTVGEHRDEDNVYSEKIMTEDTEKTEAYEYTENQEHDPSWLNDSKDAEGQFQRNNFLDEEDELDIAIINDIAITEDDTTLRAFTFRAIFTGFVSEKTIVDSNVCLLIVSVGLDSCCP